MKSKGLSISLHCSHSNWEKKIIWKYETSKATWEKKSGRKIKHIEGRKGVFVGVNNIKFSYNIEISLIWWVSEVSPDWNGNIEIISKFASGNNRMIRNLMNLENIQRKCNSKLINHSK